MLTHLSLRQSRRPKAMQNRLCQLHRLSRIPTRRRRLAKVEKGQDQVLLPTRRKYCAIISPTKEFATKGTNVRIVIPRKCMMQRCLKGREEAEVEIREEKEAKVHLLQDGRRHAGNGRKEAANLEVAASFSMLINHGLNPCGS